MITVKELIEQAIRKYPVTIHYKGKLSDSEIEELEKVCDVRRLSVYMDGSAMYSIRHKKADNKSMSLFMKTRL